MACYGVSPILYINYNKKSGIVVLWWDLPINDKSLRFIIVCVQIRKRFEMGAVGQIGSLSVGIESL